MSYDVIVIGSGIGGLTTAGLLARAAGKRVLVLERHTEPGGLTHTFRRDGASWDVGVHYIGQLGPGSQGRAYFDYLSGGELEWNRMPDSYDRFVYPGVDLRVSSDPLQYERDLVAAFPQEARAIHRYFQDVRRVTRWVALGFVQGMIPRPAASLLRAAQRLGGRKATQTTKAYLDTHFRSPRLKAVLASQWGGLRPAAVPIGLCRARDDRLPLPRGRLVPPRWQRPDRPHLREGHRADRRRCARRSRGHRDPH